MSPSLVFTFSTYSCYRKMLIRLTGISFYKAKYKIKLKWDFCGSTIRTPLPLTEPDTSSSTLLDNLSTIPPWKPGFCVIVISFENCGFYLVLLSMAFVCPYSHPGGGESKFMKKFQNFKALISPQWPWTDWESLKNVDWKSDMMLMQNHRRSRSLNLTKIDLVKTVSPPDTDFSSTWAMSSWK